MSFTFRPFIQATHCTERLGLDIIVVKRDVGTPAGNRAPVAQTTLLTELSRFGSLAMLLYNFTWKKGINQILETMNAEAFTTKPFAICI
jgi:hypothetical protein